MDRLWTEEEGACEHWGTFLACEKCAFYTRCGSRQKGEEQRIVVSGRGDGCNAHLIMHAVSRCEIEARRGLREVPGPVPRCTQLLLILRLVPVPFSSERKGARRLPRRSRNRA